MMTRLFEDDYIRRCSSLRAPRRSESSALDAKTSLISGRGSGEEAREDRRPHIFGLFFILRDLFHLLFVTF